MPNTQGISKKLALIVVAAMLVCALFLAITGVGKKSRSTAPAQNDNRNINQVAP